MNKVISFFVVLIAAGSLLMTGSAHAQYAAIMVDAENGDVLHEVNATRLWYPASLTKVMTLYMTFDALRNGQIRLHGEMTTSPHASRQPNSKLGLRAGERITVEDAILAVITRSANDAAVVLSEHIGGTEENFADQMTAKARQLGMNNTRFMNATGLPNNFQVTTPRDLALLAWKIMKNFPNYYSYFASPGFNFKGRELRGINKFTARYPGAEGMKTGFTCGSGFNLMSTATQNGKRLIGVIMGGMTSAERYQLMTAMMDAGFSNRYGDVANRNIITMSESLGGEPPYQLDCGNRSGVSSVSGNSTSKRSHKALKRSTVKKSSKQKRAHTASGYHRVSSGKPKTARKTVSRHNTASTKSKRTSTKPVAQKTSTSKKKTVKSSTSGKTVKKSQAVKKKK